MILGLAVTLAACQASELSVKPPTPEPAASEPPPCRRWPDRLRPHRQQGVDRSGAQAAFADGRSAADASQWYAAEQAFRRAVELDDGFALAHLELAQVLAHTGGAAELRRGHLAAALAELPNNPRAHFLFADTLASTEEPEAALLHYRCALQLKPGARSFRRRAVRVALDVEGVAAAEDLAEPLLEEPVEPRDWLTVAEVAERAERWRAAGLAVEAAAKALGSAPLYRRAAGLLERAGERERAETARIRAEAIDPREAERELRPLRPSRR